MTSRFDRFKTALSEFIANAAPAIVVFVIVALAVNGLRWVFFALTDYRPTKIELTVTAHLWETWQAEQKYAPFTWYTEDCLDSTVNGTPARVCNKISHTDNRWQDMEPLTIWGAIGEPIVYPEPYTLGVGNQIGNIRPLPKRGVNYYIGFKREDGAKFNYPMGLEQITTYAIGSRWLVPVDIFGNEKYNEMQPEE